MASAFGDERLCVACAHATVGPEVPVPHTFRLSGSKFSGRAALGIDVGGTSTRAAVVRLSSNGHIEIIGHAACATRAADVATSILHAVRQTLSYVPDIPLHDIGIALPEYVHSGRLRSALVVELPDRRLDYLAVQFATMFSRPINLVLESDVRAGARAEYYYLQKRPDDRESVGLSLLYISWGTGIASTLVLPDGKCWEGTNGAALTIGEWRSPRNELNLEGFVSGSGIAQHWQQQTGEKRTAREIIDLAAAGSDEAERLLTSAGVALGAAIRELSLVLDPSDVVVGGGLGSANTPAWKGLLASVRIDVPGRRSPPIHHARLGTRSGVVGAALCALSNIEAAGRSG